MINKLERNYIVHVYDVPPRGQRIALRHVHQTDTSAVRTFYDPRTQSPSSRRNQRSDSPLVYELPNGRFQVIGNTRGGRAPPPPPQNPQQQTRGGQGGPQGQQRQTRGRQGGGQGGQQAPQGPPGYGYGQPGGYGYGGGYPQGYPQQGYGPPPPMYGPPPPVQRSGPGAGTMMLGGLAGGFMVRFRSIPKEVIR